MTQFLTKEVAVKRIEEALSKEIQTNEKFNFVNLKIALKYLKRGIRGKSPIENGIASFDFLIREKISELSVMSVVWSLGCVKKFSELFQDKNPPLINLGIRRSWYEIILLFASIASPIITIIIALLV